MLAGRSPLPQRLVEPVEAKRDVLHAGTAALAEQTRAKLMMAMDALNHRFGRDSVRLGSTAVASSGADVRVWATKQERRSPRYTTRWAEMATVRTK